MQQDVKVFNPKMLIDIFPGLTVQKKPFHYNLHVDRIETVEIIKLAELTKKTDTDIFIYRHGKGLTIKVAPSTPLIQWVNSKEYDVFNTLGNVFNPNK